MTLGITLAATMTVVVTDSAMEDSCYLRITHIIRVKQKNRWHPLYMFSAGILSCQLQKYFLNIGIIAATRRAITQVSKNVRTDGCRLPCDNLQLKGNQRIENNKIKENAIWSYPAYENGCNCTYRHSGTSDTYNLSGAFSTGKGNKTIDLYYLLSIIFYKCDVRTN